MALLRVPTDHASFGIALSFANPGDTIRILAGYAVTESVTVNDDSLIIEGLTTFAGLTLTLGAGISAVTLTGTTPFNVIDNGGANSLTMDAGSQRATVTGGIDSVTIGLGGTADTDRLTVDWSGTTGNVTGGFVSYSGAQVDNDAYGTFYNSNGLDQVGFSGVEAFDVRTGSGNDSFTTSATTRFPPALATTL